MGKSIVYNTTGRSDRGTRSGYHGSPIPREFHIVTKDDIKDINSKYFVQDVRTGKYYKTNFTIGFELEKINLPALVEYAIFKGYERDGSLSGRNSGEAITNILPLVPKGRLRNKVFELMFQAERVIDSDVNNSCGGHITICNAGTDGDELRDKVRSYMGLMFALYRGRLRNSYCNRDIRMTSGTDRYSVIGVKSGGCIEIRLPSGVPSVHSLVRRYELVFELVDFAVNRRRINFSKYLEKCRPIVMRMYGYNEPQTDFVMSLAKDFQYYINTGRVRDSITRWIRR